MSLLLSFVSTAICLLLASSACHDLKAAECQSVQFYRADFHSSDVDEFPAPHHGMADASGKNGVINSILSFVHPPGNWRSSTLQGDHSWHGLQFSAFMVLPIYNVIDQD